NTPGLAFALTSSGIFRSSDAGLHWTQVSGAGLSTIPFIPVHALAFNPFDNGQLCALSDSNMSCTANLGETWAAFPQPGLTFLLFDPGRPDGMFMGTPYGTDWLYVSTDHGRTWSVRGSFDVHPWFHGRAAVDSRSGAVVEAGSPHGGCIPACSLFRSDDGGSTWREIVAEEDAWTLATDRAGRSALYVTAFASLSVSA